MSSSPRILSVRPTAATESAAAPSIERHYSPPEIAEFWGLSVDTVRKIFEVEPGVLVIGNQLPRRGKRSYTTLRIPAHVLERVHRRLSRV
jgi:hypothetical protein